MMVEIVILANIRKTIIMRPHVKVHHSGVQGIKAGLRPNFRQIIIRQVVVWQTGLKNNLTVILENIKTNIYLYEGLDQSQ